MYNPEGKNKQGSKRLKSEELFMEAVANFNQSFYRDEPVSQINTKILEKYLILPGTLSASVFYLDHESFEFHLGHAIESSNEEQQEIFDGLVEDGIIAEALDKGEMVFSTFDSATHVIIIPVISPIGIMGTIQILGNMNIKFFSENINNYIYLHANQFAFLMTNAKLKKEIDNLETELEQKISLRVEKIKQAQRELQLILNSILTGVFIIEKATGTIINVNDAAVEMLNTERDSIIGTKRNEWEYFENLLQTPKTHGIPNKVEETFLLNAQKSPFPVIKTITNLFVGNKDIYLESFIDISDRKKYETDLHNQAELLKGVDKATNSLLVESSFNSSINKALEYLGTSTNADRVYIYQNISNDFSQELKAERKFKWKNEQAPPFNELYKVLSYENELKEWYALLSEQKSVFGIVNKLNYKVKDLLKKIGIKSLLIVPIYVENAYWGFICFDDMCKEREWSDSEEAIIKAAAASIGGAIERNQSKLQLLEAVERAEKADRSDKLKSEFLAQMSHEIRTPINSILSFASILKQEFEENLNEDLKTTFDVISRAGMRIIRTVDLILNMSELQTGIYDYVKSDFDLLEEVIEPIYREYKTRIKSKNVGFNINNYCESSIVSADKYSLTQIFYNLIDNAYKYTDTGEIDITITFDANSMLRVEVRDTGIGISSNYMARIFEPFSQEDQGYTRKYEGNGLGLALVKKYCDMNNLIIRIESQKGVGTKFIITFPVSAAVPESSLQN